MKMNLSLIVSLVTFLTALIFSKNPSWLPLSIVIASLVSAQTNGWVASDRLGTAVRLSVYLKFLFSLIGLYSLIGIFVCVILLIKWFIF